MIIKLIFLLILDLKLIFCATWFGNFFSFSSWNIKHSNLAEMRDIVNDPKGGPHKVLRVRYLADWYWTSPNKSGTQFYIYPLENIFTLLWREENCLVYSEEDLGAINMTEIIFRTTNNITIKGIMFETCK